MLKNIYIPEKGDNDKSCFQKQSNRIKDYLKLLLTFGNLTLISLNARIFVISNNKRMEQANCFAKNIYHLIYYKLRDTGNTTVTTTFRD